MAKSHGDSIAALLKDRQAGQKITALFKDYKVVLYLAQAYLMWSAISSFWSVSLDYFKNTLHLPEEVINKGYMILGIMMTVAGAAYAAFSKFVSFSAVVMNVIFVFMYGLFIPSVLLSKTTRSFYIVTAMLGFIRCAYYNNISSACIELTDSKRGVTLYLILSIFSGIGGLITPYLAAYLQVEVNNSAAILLSLGLISLALILCIPISIKMLISPRVYKTDTEQVHEVSYQSIMHI